MRTKQLSLILSLVFTTVMTLDAMAWGGLGHRTIAEIAERHLTPTAKANIEKYTGGTPLADYSIWLDMVRKNEPYYAELTDGWHASIVTADCKSLHEVREKYRKGRDAVSVTLMYEEMFRHREKLTDSAVMVAIKAIVHMVGDMHCPAHVRYTDNDNGCKFNITYLGYDRTYHRVWDASILNYGHKKWSYQQYADKLDTYNAKEIKRVTAGWLEDWMEENGRVVRPTLDWVKPGDELYLDFVEKAQPMAHELIQKAGYRLAKVLNVFFK